MNDPKISVIVPVYNVEPYISKCLASLINQDFEDFEIIIVDDGSQDMTLEICKEFLFKNRRIKLFHQENKGVSAARNMGLSLSNAEYISFVDGDDYVDSSFLSSLYYAIKRTENCDLSMCYFEKRYYNGEKIKDISRPTFMIEKVMNEDSFWNTPFGMKGISNVMTNKLIRRSLFDGLKFEGAVYEDSRMIHHLIKQANNIILIPKILYFIRRWSNSLTYSTSKTIIWESNYQVSKERFVDFYARNKFELALKFLNSCIFCIRNLASLSTYKKQKNKIRELKKLQIKWGGVILNANCFCCSLLCFLQNGS